jgi:hypothetical protein
MYIGFSRHIGENTMLHHEGHITHALHRAAQKSSLALRSRVQYRSYMHAFHVDQAQGMHKVQASIVYLSISPCLIITVQARWVCNDYRFIVYLCRSPCLIQQSRPKRLQQSRMHCLAQQITTSTITTEARSVCNDHGFIVNLSGLPCLL